jgi:hypothetical protein
MCLEQNDIICGPLWDIIQTKLSSDEIEESFSKKKCHKIVIRGYVRFSCLANIELLQCALHSTKHIRYIDEQNLEWLLLHGVYIQVGGGEQTHNKLSELILCEMVISAL